MDNITSKLKNIFSIREIYILLTIILVVLFISISSSLAVFNGTTEKLGIAKVIANDVTQVLSSQEEGYNINSDKHSGTISVESKSKKVFDITVKNENTINTKYKMYYQFSGNVKIIDVDVGISTKSANEAEDVIKPSEEKKVKIIINNKSEQDADIIIGVQGGYENNDVVLTSERNEMEKIQEGTTLAEATLADNELKTGYSFTTESQDKGLYKLEENDKISFFKGAVENNYVEFGTYKNDEPSSKAKAGDKILWRIVRINGDESVTLIKEYSLSGSTWSNNNKSDYEDSEIKSIVNNWYSSTFTSGGPEDNLVMTSEFCNDRSDSYNAVRKRLNLTPPTPTLTCAQQGDKITAKAGLLTADELIYAGVPNNNSMPNHNLGYLGSGGTFWTMSPSGTEYAYLTEINYGYYQYNVTPSDYYPPIGSYMVRPVITLLPDTLVLSDSEDGTKDNPYKINLNLPTLSETILASETPITNDPKFTQESDDRGLFEMTTNKGKIYYFKGSATNSYINKEYVMHNYVEFGTYKSDVENEFYYSGSPPETKVVAHSGDAIKWEVLRINEDGSVKLIATDATDANSTPFNSSGKSDFVNQDGSDSEIKKALDDWYSNTFPNESAEDNLVIKTEFCNDRSDDYGAVNSRLYKTEPQPTIDCKQSNDKITTKVGLITADEYTYRVGIMDEIVFSTNGFANHPVFGSNILFWTMSPKSSDTMYFFDCRGGFMSTAKPDSQNSGISILPVITISSEASVISGSGTYSDPYKIWIE